jgi:hypothetical protein
VDKHIESNTVTDNIIKFPNKPTEEVKVITDEIELQKQSLSFAYEVIDNIHDMLHEETGSCIYTDEEFMPITIFAAEVISAMWLMTQGVNEHPMQDIANDLFGDIDVDNSQDLDYDDYNEDKEKD